MANNLTNAEENRLLDLSLEAGTKLHLYTDNPGEAGGGTEVAGGSYAAQVIAWSAAAAGAKAPSADIVFPEATADWGNVTHAAIKTAAGAMRWYGPLTNARNVVTGVVFRVPLANLACTLD